MLCSIIRRTIVLGSRNTQKLVSLLIRAMSFVINWMYSTHRLQSTQLPAPNPCSRAGRRHHPIFWFTQGLRFVHRDQVNGGYRTYPRCLPRVHPAFQLLQYYVLDVAKEKEVIQGAFSSGGVDV